jgi:hemerythrin-like domain-containing protein
MIGSKRHEIIERMGPQKEALTVEHQRLLQQTAELEHEADELSRWPQERKAHASIRAKLRAHVKALHEHIERWQADAEEPVTTD